MATAYFGAKKKANQPYELFLTIHRAAIVSDFIRRVRIFLGKTPATEFLSQNTDNARAASEPSYGKETVDQYTAWQMAQSLTMMETCSLGGCIQFNMKNFKPSNELVKKCKNARAQLSQKQ